MRRGLSRTILVGAVVGTAVGALGVPAPTAAGAAGPTGWAVWSPLSGGANAYATTMQLPATGFPRASVTSTSRAPAQLPSGASAYLGGTADPVPTPVGLKYGSSKGNAYLNLRPEADTASAPSRTTYTFETATPDGGWTFVLGDIDSDAVRIEAKDADGTPVPAATVDQWFRGTFNYAGAADRPTWQPATSTLVGNPGALDTNGAAAWFEPDVALSVLTFDFTRRAGFPVYQTWFATLHRSITGTVTDASTGGASCPVADVVVRLVSPDGRELATTRPVDGAYAFDGSRPGRAMT